MGGILVIFMPISLRENAKVNICTRFKKKKKIGTQFTEPLKNKGRNLYKKGINGRNSELPPSLFPSIGFI